MMKIDKKDLRLFAILFIVFFVIFFVIFLLLSSDSKNDYNKYIDTVYNDTFTDIESVSLNIAKEEDVKKDIGTINIDQTSYTKERYEKIKNELKSKILQKKLQFQDNLTNINYVFIPKNIEENFVDSLKYQDLNFILYSNIFSKKNLKLNIELNQNINDVRGKYKDKTIKIFNVENLETNELISVFIHELGHYFDIDYLDNGMLYDVSENFYDLSWNSTKILKQNMLQTDFVSGYALSNKYEDFAESFISYILFNDDFYNKSLKSETLQKKYDFFAKYIFRNNEFKNTSFNKNPIPTDYYRDCTKIEVNLEKLLDYLNKGI